MMNKNHWCHIKKKILNILDMEIERFILEQHLKTQKASKIDDYTKKKKRMFGSGIYYAATITIT